MEAQVVSGWKASLQEAAAHGDTSKAEAVLRIAEGIFTLKHEIQQKLTELDAKQVEFNALVSGKLGLRNGQLHGKVNKAKDAQPLVGLAPAPSTSTPGRPHYRAGIGDELLKLLQTQPKKVWLVKEMSDTLKHPLNAVQGLLSKSIKFRLVKRISRGKYKLTTRGKNATTLTKH